MRTFFSKTWLQMAVILSLVCVTVLVVTHYSFRQNANDPQIQLSEDFARTLGSGGKAGAIIYPGPVDIGQSLSVFVITYDGEGKVGTTTVQLDGKVPTLPQGVLDYTRQHGQDRITWQPKPGVRFAVVATSYTDAKGTGVVLVGRSLREVEKRERDVLIIVGIAWVGMLLVSGLLPLLLAKKSAKK